MDTFFNLEGIGKDIAVLRNSDDKKKDKVICMTDNNDNIRNPLEVVETNKDEKIQVIPSSQSERSVIYVVGMSGSGKSHWTTNYVKEYKKKFKKNKIYVISPITDDKNINSLKGTRINPNSEAYMVDPPTVEDFQDSLLICDDIEAYDKKTVNRILNLVNSICTTGRHYKTSLLFLAHNATNGSMSKILLSESQAIVLFPQTMAGKTSKYLLDNYFGFDKSQIEKVKKVKTRAIVIMRTYPMVIITENIVVPLNKF
jgi:hypothetical protein